MAEIAIDLNAALFRHHAADFLATKHQQHIADFAAGAGAGKFNSLRFKNAGRGFMVKAVKGVMSVQTGQFLRSKRLRKRGHMRQA